MSAPHTAAVSGAAALQPRGLRRFTTPRPPRAEVCELCGVPVAPEHRHLVDTERRALACACPACAQVMARPGATGGGRFRAVPDRVLTDPDHRFDDGLWNLLAIPVSVAFFFHNTALDRLVALYPSPAGATERELEPRERQTVLDATALAGELAPDTEALLVRRTGEETECHLVPVDRCYALVGRMRLLWHGFDGGAEARADLDAFFDDVRRKARTTGADPS